MTHLGPGDGQGPGWGQSTVGIGQSGAFTADETISVKVRFENYLAPDRYAMTTGVSRAGTGADMLDHREDVATLLIHGTYASGALTELPYELEIER